MHVAELFLLSLFSPCTHSSTFSRLPSTDQVIIRMSPSYPHEHPKCYLADKGLKFKDGSLVKDMGTSSSWHLLDPSSEGMPQVCHGRPALWNAKKSLASVFTKAFMWLEAFEHHLKTGSTLDTYLRHQPNRA